MSAAQAMGESTCWAAPGRARSPHHCIDAVSCSAGAFPEHVKEALMLNGPCPFCCRSSLVLIAENELAFALHDKFPVRPLHTLMIRKRHAVDIFHTSSEEREAMHDIASRCRLAILREDSEVGGFNFGSNVGQVAGQKIFHAHIHLIPRRTGDASLPAAHPND